MMALPHSDIIRAQEAASFEVTTVCNDLFGSTWAQSYVRLVEVITTARVPNQINLAYTIALARSTSDVVAVVAESCFEPASVENLRLFHSRALALLTKPDHDRNPPLITALNAIEISLATNIFSVDLIKAHSDLLSQYRRSKPREEMLFKIAGKFLYLAIHSES